MDNYHIDSSGSGFQVIEEIPEGRHNGVDGFSAKTDPQRWLNGFRMLIGLIDCLSGKQAMSTLPIPC
jgi:hypothetical protein